MEIEAGELGPDRFDSSCGHDARGVESSPMRAVVLVVGGLAVVVIGLVIASMLVEPAPASGGAGTAQHHTASAPKNGPAWDAPVTPPGPTADGGVLPGEPPTLHQQPSTADAPSPRERVEPQLRSPDASVPSILEAPPSEESAQLPDAGSRYVFEHVGPEPEGKDPCTVPIYSWGTKHRSPIHPWETQILSVRVTVENYTNIWRFNPDKPGTAYVGVVPKLGAERIIHGDGDKLSVKYKSVRVGSRELTDVVLPFSYFGSMDGGLFGSTLIDLFDMSVDWDRAELVFNSCSK